jgi:hypothetical protein
MRLPSLYQFFRHQVGHGFHRHGITEPATVDYVSDILTRFAQVRQLYALRDANDQPLEYIVDMLETWHMAQGGAGSPGRGRFILRHIGEYTLFISAYWRCADFEVNPRQRQVYWHLHQDFGRISSTLDNMRREQFPLPPSADSVLTAFWRV